MCVEDPFLQIQSHILKSQKPEDLKQLSMYIHTYATYIV